MNEELKFMQRAFELAENARGRCSPNPFVGAVIVKNARIIGEGWTQAYGSDHAEVQALKNCTEDCHGADMFVTLEPCSHYGKTPPCAEAVIDAGIARVFIGIEDPNPLVSGKGIRLLKEAGIEVKSGLLAKEISRQLECYLTYITKRRPFVLLKTAVSLDGRIAAEDGSSRWISCEESVKEVHKLREEADAILTGSGTVLQDDPLLNVRLENPIKQPLRVILDAHYQVPETSQIVQTAKQYPTLIFTDAAYSNPAKEQALLIAGIEICKLPAYNGLFDLKSVLDELYKRQVQFVLLETGSRLNTSFLKAGLIDKIVMFIAPKLLGGKHLAWNEIGIDNIANALPLKDLECKQSGIDLRVTAYPIWQSTE